MRPEVMSRTAQRISLLVRERDKRPHLFKEKRINFFVIEDIGDKDDPQDNGRNTEKTKKPFRPDVIRLIENNEENYRPDEKEKHKRQDHEFLKKRKCGKIPVRPERGHAFRNLFVKEPDIEEKDKGRYELPENLYFRTKPEKDDGNPPNNDKRGD
jgi:hypothetical protein